jgi:hypothetical protein
MNDPIIICPKCKTEIKITESLAAPLIESMREQFDQKIALKDEEIQKREKILFEGQIALKLAETSIDDKVSTKIMVEREKIVIEEAKKARLAATMDLERKSRENAELQEILKVQNEKLCEAQKAQADVLRKQRELDDAKREIELTVEKRVQDSLTKVRDDATKIMVEREKIVIEEAKKARLAATMNLERKSRENAELQEILKVQNEKLSEAQKAQADVLRKQRELDDAKREIELTVEKRVQDSLTKVRNDAKLTAEESQKLKLSEKEQIIISMQRQIEELKRRSEQGSQQLQGEVQELELESLLRQKFPQDLIEAVSKGESGADVVQHVVGPLGKTCGTMLWECKRTKHWNDNWLPKLRDDQRAVKADIALIISEALPKEMKSFDIIDGIWVVDPKYAIPVARIMRHSLLELAMARQSSEGQNTKMEMVYQYLTGQRFRQRVEVIVEKFSDMHDDLDKERKTMTKLWAKREEQINRVIEATSGMYGDLQGIAGKSLQEIEGLNIVMIEKGDNTH